MTDRKAVEDNDVCIVYFQYNVLLTMTLRSYPTQIFAEFWNVSTKRVDCQYLTICIKPPLGNECKYWTFEKSRLTKTDTDSQCIIIPTKQLSKSYLHVTVNNISSI